MFSFFWGFSSYQSPFLGHKIGRTESCLRQTRNDIPHKKMIERECKLERKLILRQELPMKQLH